MHELPLYFAILSELDESELVELFGRELRRRGRVGAAISVNFCGRTYCASVYPDEWSDMRTLPLHEQLLRLAAYTMLGVEAGRKVAGPDDEVVGAVGPV